MSSHTTSNGVDEDAIGSRFERLVDERTLRQSSEQDSQRAPMPFAWQHGTQLILLDDDPEGWVMAELQFDSDLCRYVEIRRAVYPLTREAIGVVISRALASGDHAAVDVALSLHHWLSTHYGISIIADPIAPPDASWIEFTA
jgi:hypothetical protein